jgi:hypothetical protein
MRLNSMGAKNHVHMHQKWMSHTNHAVTLDWPCICHSWVPPRSADIDRFQNYDHTTQSHTDRKYMLETKTELLPPYSHNTNLPRLGTTCKINITWCWNEVDTLTVFEVDGVPVIPVLAVGTARPPGVVQTFQALSGRYAAGVRVRHVDVSWTLAGTAFLTLHRRVAIVTRGTPNE